MHGRIVSLLACVLVCVSTQSALAAAGRTAGNFAVGPQGSAQYSIPIVLPPGTAGLTPRLSFDYDSRIGASALGVGWTIGGLSTITRCPRTMVQDGAPRSVRLDIQDRYCLDGRRLRLTSGNYGEPNSQYQTEIESFTRVTGYGSVGTSPWYFIAERQDGLIYEYGNTTDSRIEAVGLAAPRVWAVNKIRDRYGNAISFTYNEDTQHGGYLISSIAYTSNDTQGTSAAYTVSFVYQSVPVGEIYSAYYAGAVVKRLNRLQRVDIKYGTTLVRRYILTYQSNLSSTLRSRLFYIEECAGEAQDCYTATSFGYQDGSSGFALATSTQQTIPDPNAGLLILDVNGDGRSDVVYSSTATPGSGSWLYALADSAGNYGGPINSNIGNTQYHRAVVLDYNGDGLDDFLVPYSGDTWWVVLGTSTGLSSPINTSVPADPAADEVRAMDVTGDGLDDLVWSYVDGVGGDAIFYRAREPSGTFSSVGALVGPVGLDNHIITPVFGNREREFSSPHRQADFNGDGFEDFVVRFIFSNPEVGPMERWTQIVLGGGAGVYPIENVPGNARAYHLDLNGDGYTDLAYPGSTNWRYIFSRGTSMQAGATGPTISNQLVGSAMVLDYEGDGYEDLVVRNTSDNIAYQLRSNGEGLQAPGHIVGADAGILHFVGDANGDGMFDEFFIQGSTLYARLRSGLAPDLLTQVTDGLGNTATFTYKRLNDPNGCYGRDVAAPSFPVRAYVGPTPIVCSLTANNGVGGNYTLSYSYWNADLHLQGRRFLGFAKRQVVDSRNGMAKLEEYSTDYSRYERLGAPLKETLRQSAGGTLISEVTNSWSHHTYGSGVNERRLPYVSQSVAKEHEVAGAQNGALIRTSTTTNSVDYTSGVAYDIVTATVEGTNANGVQPGTSYVQRAYQPVADLIVNTSTWCIGRPRRVETSRSHDQYGGSQLTRAVTVDWDEQKCRPINRVSQPGDSLLQVTQALGYDDFGNLNREDVTGVGMTTRSTIYGWGTDGHFLRSVTNALNQTTTLTWDALVGMPETLTDPNQITIEWDYDALGRRVSENRPDGTSSIVTYEACSASVCPNVTGARIVIRRTERSTGLATIGQERVYLDAFERPIVAGTPSLSGADTRIAREYDARGRVKRDGVPCWWSGCTPAWTVYDYDLLDRVTQIERPLSDSDSTPVLTRIYYEGLKTRVVDALNKETTKVANVLGGMVRSADHSGYGQVFDYDAFGNPVRVTDTLGATLITNAFNVMGMRTAQADRAAGNRTYVPNALGEITTELDGNGQTTSFEYDLLGRLKRRVEAEGISEWAWGTSAAAKNIGSLAGVSGPGYSEGYAYDSVGRLAQTTINADASSYVFNYSYDDIGALSTVTYPATTSSSRLKLQYEYQNGFMERVKDFDNPSTVYWAANSTDAAGHVIDETLGNGVHTIRGYDTVTGAIDYIQSGVGGGTTVQNLSYFWNEVGNLEWRQDVNLALTETFGYDDLHRLETITGPDPTTIEYDERGNILSRSNNPDRSGRQTIEWTSYDLPRLITGETGYSSQFSYTPDRARWKQVAAYGGTSETTLYIGGLLEKTTLGSAVAWKHYIMAPGGPAALQVRTASSTQMLYLNNDHLGSVDSVTNAAGALVTRMSYGPFGQRRNATAWAGDPTTADWSAIANTTRDGFTGHAMLDNLSLIHMNGRVFDPLAGSFLSADPFVPNPGLTQSFNRYAYVRNNPLSLVDPSGYQERTLLDSPFEAPDGTGAFDGFLGDWVNDIYYDNYVMRNLAAGRPVGVRRSMETDTRQGALPESTVGVTGAPYQLIVTPFNPYLAAKTGDYSDSINLVPRCGGDVWAGVEDMSCDKLIQTTLIEDVLTIGAAGTGILKAGRGLTVDGLANEFRLQYKHIPGTTEGARALRQVRKRSAHFFFDRETLAAVEAAIIERGVETGVIRGATRYGLRFTNPIGYRVGRDGTRIPLYYGELKLSSDGLYHVVPRTGPATATP